MSPFAIVHDYEPETDDSLPIDTIYDLLSDRRRRHVLRCLRDLGSLALPDLVNEIVRRERDAPVAEVPEEEIQRVYLSLWHVHVPKLDEADVVDHDRGRNVVTLGTHADVVESHISSEPAEYPETA